MKKFISLSQYPGKTGEYFYTKFFEHYNIDATYEPRACDDLEIGIRQALQDEVNGISISMPYKQRVIKYANHKHAYVELYNSCNTIKIDKSKTYAFNADIAGVEYICKQIKQNDKIAVLGAGAIGSMFIKYLEEEHYGNLTVCARSLGTWHERFKPADVIINCTALGTSTKDSPYLLGQIPPNARLVIDLAIKDNEFKEQCMSYGIKYISGREFYREQFLKQFEIYTGIKPSREVYDEIESRQYETI
jgi:shikimate 5-dehydrogenase